MSSYPVLRFSNAAETERKLTRSRKPQDRLLRAEALCFLQREEEAAELVQSAPWVGAAAPIHSALASHFASRAAMTAKLQLEDPVGAKWGQVYATHPDFRPQCRLSATLIVKNEERCIERCLRSIAEICDEIILVDTGSTDRTLEIANGLGLPHLIVDHFDWIDDFAAARNQAASLATGDWGLWIDADEELLPQGLGSLRQGLIRPHFGGFHIRLENFTDGEGNEGVYTHSPLRIYRLGPFAKFRNRIHENVSDSIAEAGFALGAIADVLIVHDGYRPEAMKAKNKEDRFISMLEREVVEFPDDAFQWFNLANAYFVSGQLKKAEHAAKTSARLAKDDFICLELDYQIAASAALGLGDEARALAHIQEYRSRAGDGIFVSFEAANCHIVAGRLEEALLEIGASLTFEWPANGTGDYGLFAFKRHCVRAQIYNMIGQPEQALADAEYVLSQAPSFAPGMLQKGLALEGLTQFDEAAQQFAAIASVPEFAPIALSGLGRCLQATGLYKEAAETFERAYQLAPKSYEAWANWADACERSGDLQSVITAYEAFAKENEPTAEVLVNWGRAQARAGNPARAIDLFTEALNRAPADANIYFNCGDLLYKLGQFGEAAHLYQHGLRLKPEFADGWFVLGNTLAQIGVVEGARIAYEQCLAAAPSHNGAQHNLQLLEGAA